MKFILILLLIAEQLSRVLSEAPVPEDIKCPPDQEVGCGNSCLEKTCGNIFYNGEPPRMCPLYCLIGCVCKAGYVWANGKSRHCVKIDTCPKICCPVNRVYKDCGPFEPRSCDNSELVICNDEDNCNEGCFCRDGLVEDGFGNCISEENCPAKCGENELADPCMNRNQPTCTNPNPAVCHDDLCQRGCVCKPPYVRNEDTGECVDRNTCGVPICLGKNQIYKQSGIDCWTCSNYKVVKCALITKPQCFCIDDYVHHDLTGACIPKSQCPPPVCGKNEVYAVGPDCQTCSNYAVVLCLPVLEKHCICKSGYYRHDVTRVCTKVEDCPVCGANQTFTNYGHRDCQMCDNWQTVDCVPNDTPACYCSDGYVHKDTSTRDCIAIEDCPTPTCGTNEVFLHEGVDGVTCENRFYVKYPPKKISMCYCLPDHVRNAQNVCTHVNDCP